MDIEFRVMNDRYMIGSGGYVFAFYFDFCPSGIECTFMVSGHKKVILFGLMFWLHQFNNNNDKM